MNCVTTCVQEAEKAGVPITLWDKFVAFGQSNPQEPSPSSFNEICTIMYTSAPQATPCCPRALGRYQSLFLLGLGYRLQRCVHVSCDMRAPVARRMRLVVIGDW